MTSTILKQLSKDLREFYRDSKVVLNKKIITRGDIVNYNVSTRLLETLFTHATRIQELGLNETLVLSQSDIGGKFRTDDLNRILGGRTYEVNTLLLQINKRGRRESVRERYQKFYDLFTLDGEFIFRYSMVKKDGLPAIMITKVVETK